MTTGQLILGISFLAFLTQGADEIPAAVAKLRSEAIEERDRAIRELIRLGETKGAGVREALNKLIDAPDAEVRLRARHVLEALEVNETLRGTYFPLRSGCRWTYSVKGGPATERTVELVDRTRARVSYCARVDAASWELKDVDVWPLKGFEGNSVAGSEWTHVYVVEEKDGFQIIATRRSARGHSGILTEIPIAVYRWGKAESWEFCTRIEDENGRTPTVAVKIERSGPENMTTEAGTFSCLKFKEGSAQTWLARGIGIVKKVIDRPGKEPEVWELKSYRTLIKE